MNKGNNYKKAMRLLKTTNIFSTLFTLTSWIMFPEKCVSLAKKIARRKDMKSIIAVGYINDFFSKYVAFNKSKEEELEINQKVDSGIETGDKLIDSLIELRKIRNSLKKNLKVNQPDQVVKTASSFGVSPGIAKGTVLNIRSSKQVVPKSCIGIFPTSGIKYTHQMLNCTGIVFLNGAMTSHGAIIARENKIPAVIAPNIRLKNGQNLIIDGSLGKVYKI